MSATLKQVAETADKIRQIEQWLNTTFFERDELIRVLLQAVATRHHVYILGLPGTGKTAIIKAMLSAVLGSNDFLSTMHPQQSADELLGAFNVKIITDEGRMVRNTNGMLPEADYAMLDEFGKASPATVQPLLSAMNERVYMEEGSERPIPLKAMFAGSNEELTEIELAAARDRFLYHIVVNSIESPSNFDKLLQQVVETPGAGMGAPPVTVTMDEIAQLQAFVPTVKVGSEVREKVALIKKQLGMNHQIVRSDRRWKWTLRAAQGAAALAGRDECMIEDLEVAKHTLWEFSSQMQTVHETVNEIAVPNVKQFLDWQRDLRSWRQKFDTLTSDSGSGQGLSRGERHAEGLELDAKLATRLTEINDEIEAANRDGRSSHKHQEFLRTIGDFRAGVYKELLGIDAAGVGLDMTNLPARK